MGKSYGFIEITGVVAAINALDIMCKTAAFFKFFLEALCRSSVSLVPDSLVRISSTAGKVNPFFLLLVIFSLAFPFFLLFLPLISNYSDNIYIYYKLYLYLLPILHTPFVDFIQIPYFRWMGP